MKRLGDGDVAVVLAGVHGGIAQLLLNAQQLRVAGMQRNQEAEGQLKLGHQVLLKATMLHALDLHLAPHGWHTCHNNCTQSMPHPSPRRTWLYLDRRSERQGAPVLIWPVARPTARSPMNESSVSPDLQKGAVRRR